MAKRIEQQNVIEMQCAGAAKEAEEQKKKNREIIRLMRSIYFLSKNHIPHSTTYKELIELQVFNPLTVTGALKHPRTDLR